MYVVPGGKAVPVRAATFDTERQVYSLALENPQRILTWTPARPEVVKIAPLACHPLRRARLFTPAAASTL